MGGDKRIMFFFSPIESLKISLYRAGWVDGMVVHGLAEWWQDTVWRRPESEGGGEENARVLMLRDIRTDHRDNSTFYRNHLNLFLLFSFWWKGLEGPLVHKILAAATLLSVQHELFKGCSIRGDVAKVYFSSPPAHHMSNETLDSHVSTINCTRKIR